MCDFVRFAGCRWFAGVCVWCVVCGCLFVCDLCVVCDFVRFAGWEDFLDFFTK